MHFALPGSNAINLLKIHGALDVFTFRDGKDLVRLLPTEPTVAGVLETLRAANDELVFVDPRSPHPVKATNEIAYADDAGEMQFLRRSLLAGAYKFDNRRSQVLPSRILDHFRSNINFVSSLVCIGYGFGDLHINQIIREWLELASERQLEIVAPKVSSIPSFLLHLSPQVSLVDATATERDLSAFVRAHQERMIEAFSNQIAEHPIHDGDIDFDAMGKSQEQAAQELLKYNEASYEDSLQAFLQAHEMPS